MNMNHAFDASSDPLAQHDALTARLAKGEPIGAREAMTVAGALAVALRASMMTSTAPSKPRAVKAAASLAFDMHAPSFTRALRLAMRACVTGGRNLIPITANVRLVASGDVLALSCNDHDREITVEVAAPGVGTWAAVVDAKTLLGAVGKAKGLLTMHGTETEERSSGGKNGVPVRTWRDTVLTIGGAVSATIQGRCVADWPKAPPQVAPYQLLIQPGELRDLLAFVEPAMSTEATRYYLNGAFIHVSAGHLAAVSTDGHRMHVAKLAAWHGLDFKGQIIPFAAVGDILAMLATPVEGFAFAVSETGVTLKAGPLSLSSKVIDGNFPDYTRVIPSAPKHSVELGSADFGDALAKAAAIKATGGDKSGMVRLTFGADVLEVSAKTAQGAYMSAEVAAPGCAHGFEVGFNGAYLRDALKVTEGERVSLNFDSPADPVTITPVNGDGSRVIVIVPLRV